MQLRFNHVFSVLMVTAAAVASFVPSTVAERLRAPVAIVFAPIAYPLSAAAGVVKDTLAPEHPPVSGDLATLARQNDQLLRELVSLSEQLEHLKQLNADRAAMGALRDVSVPARVIGADAASGRYTLHLQVDAAAGVADGMKVIYPGGLLGEVTGAALGSATVRLVTDPQFKVVARFVRILTDEAGGVSYQPVSQLAPRVDGQPDGTMVVSNLQYSLIQEAGIQVGDWLTVNDDEWPANLRGLRIGKVTEIGLRPDNPLIARIRVSPTADLLRQREVMVVNRIR